MPVNCFAPDTDSVLGIAMICREIPRSTHSKQQIIKLAVLFFIRNNNARKIKMDE